MPITIDDTGQTVTLNPPYSPVTPDDSLQKITMVYFAKKTVTQNGANVAFTRIDSLHTQVDNAGAVLPYDAILGKTVYLVIETTNMATLSIDAVVRPSDNALTGNTDTLTLLKFNTVTQVYESTRLLTAVVGNFDALNNRITPENPTGSHAHYTNLTDHANKAIIKLQLRPSNLLIFNAWARNIATANGVSNIEVVIERTDNEQCAYGVDATEEVREAGVFLNTDALGRFRITNRKVFNIYHGSNAYNTYAMVGNPQRRRRIGKILNANSTEVIYFYYDQHDNEHRICSRVISRQNQKRRVPVIGLAQRGRLLETVDYMPNRNASEGIDAYRLKIYQNGTLGEGTGGDKWYGNQGENTVELVDMDILQVAGVGSQTFEAFNFEQDGVHIRYGFVNSRRRSIRPDLFAGFLGALAQFRQQGHNHYIVSQGFSYSDASCYPSAEHVNGEAGDLNLLTVGGDGASTLLTNANYDYDNQLILRNILYDFGFLNARSESQSNNSNRSRADNTPVILPHSINTVTPRHHNHLHIHGFNVIRDIYE
ncbi:hypothetical protein [Flavobacterium sp.]|uniref:hypothetical protein n=1 Tax=Flavobacterium sp. TaxID=239 RepID=UPI00286A1AF1|nr:hypothetical protein [Flavobacterium sp.]